MRYKISQYAKRNNVHYRTVWNWVKDGKLTTERTDTGRILIIEDEGLRIIGLSSPEFTLADCPTMDDKREISLKSSDRLKQERNELHGYFL